MFFAFILPHYILGEIIVTSSVIYLVENYPFIKSMKIGIVDKEKRTMLILTMILTMILASKFLLVKFNFFINLPGIPKLRYK